MNIYSIFVLPKEDTNFMEIGKNIIVSPLDSPTCIAVHGATDWQKVWDMLKSGMAPEAVEEQICPYCLGLWSGHTADQVKDHQEARKEQ